MSGQFILVEFQYWQSTYYIFMPVIKIFTISFSLKILPTFKLRSPIIHQNSLRTHFINVHIPRSITFKLFCILHSLCIKFIQIGFAHFISWLHSFGLAYSLNGISQVLVVISCLYDLKKTHLNREILLRQLSYTLYPFVSWNLWCWGKVPS